MRLASHKLPIATRVVVRERRRRRTDGHRQGAQLSDPELEDALREAKQELVGGALRAVDAPAARTTAQSADASPIARILTVQRERKLGERLREITR